MISGRSPTSHSNSSSSNQGFTKEVGDLGCLFILLFSNTRNRLSVLMEHLLKWDYLVQRRSRSWLATIRVQRRDTLRLLKDNPSLKSYLEDTLLEAYGNSREVEQLGVKLTYR